MRLRKLIPDRGHVERPALVPAAVRCAECDDVRRKDQPWARPCERSRSTTPLVVAIPTTHAEIHRGFHRGVTKPGD